MPWRLLIDDPADGATNMAVDEALLESTRASASAPTVRFYRFSNPTLTFGYGQKLSEIVDEEQCRALGIDCVRRITGGRALLHQHELTYAVTAATLSPPFPESVKSTYQSVRETIRRALVNLGVPVDATSSPPELERASADLPCLAVPTGHEITVEGKKIVAASMRWRREAFLLHGSILWAIDRDLWRRITRGGTSGELRAIGIREVFGDALGEQRLIEALTSSFEELLGTPPVPAPLTAEESRHARRLREKYRSEPWTRRLEASFTSG